MQIAMLRVIMQSLASAFDGGDCMYRLMKEEKEIALANTMHYIRMQENGAYGLCGKHEAEGVAADNKVYLFNQDIDTIEYFDGKAVINEAINDNETAFAILRGETV